MYLELRENEKILFGSQTAQACICYGCGALVDGGYKTTHTRFHMDVDTGS